MSPNPTDPNPPALSTPAEALRWAAQMGATRLDAQVLLGHVLDKPRAWLIAHDNDALDAPLGQAFAALIRRRCQGEPVAYLVGHKEFFGLTLTVTPDTLVPRPDTETLVEWALGLPGSDAAWSVVDLGTGSGCIALALRSARPQWQVSACDRSAAALAVARANGERLQLPVRWLESSWLQAFHAERFDLIVSNPPYIESADPHLDALVHEPLSALASGPDGLADLRTLCATAPQHLRPGGWLLLEHGFDQADAVAQLLREAGFHSIGHRLDLAGHRRCTGGRWG